MALLTPKKSVIGFYFIADLKSIPPPTILRLFLPALPNAFEKEFSFMATMR